MIAAEHERVPTSMAQPFNSNNQMPFEARNFHGNFVNNVESVAGFTRHILPGQIV